MKKYPNMQALFEREPLAKEYFEELPIYIQEQISTRADSVNSYDSLRDYAENLLRGDD